MACPNCSNFHKTCKAECCDMAPLEKGTIELFFERLQQPVIKQENIGNMVIPFTADGKCPFLQADFGCAIYDHRPELCKKFGDESDIRMTCAYQTKGGQKRPDKDQKRIHALQVSATQDFLKR